MFDFSLLYIALSKLSVPLFLSSFFFCFIKNATFMRRNLKAFARRKRKPPSSTFLFSDETPNRSSVSKLFYLTLAVRRKGNYLSFCSRISLNLRPRRLNAFVIKKVLINARRIWTSESVN